MSSEVVEALEKAGIIPSKMQGVRRVTIDLVAHQPAIINIEQYVDERLLQVMTRSVLMSRPDM
jgi:hypothetical protein